MHTSQNEHNRLSRWATTLSKIATVVGLAIVIVWILVVPVLTVTVLTTLAMLALILAPLAVAEAVLRFVVGMEMRGRDVAVLWARLRSFNPTRKIPKIH